MKEYLYITGINPCILKFVAFDKSECLIWLGNTRADGVDLNFARRLLHTAGH